MIKMKTKYLSLLLSGLCIIGCMAADAKDNKDKEREFIVWEGPDVRKKVPVYRFQDDVFGTFLERFCDSLSHFDDRGKYNILAIDEIEKINFAHEGNESEYLYVYQKDMDSASIAQVDAVIELPSSGIVILPDINKAVTEKLRLKRAGSMVLDCKKYVKPKDPPGIMTLIVNLDYFPCEAILRIMPNKKVDPMFISFRYSDEFQAHFGWIEQFYRENSFSPTMTYTYLPDLFGYFALLFDSIPTEIKEEVNDKGEKQYVVSYNLDDILKLKYKKTNLRQNIPVRIHTNEDIREAIMNFREQHKLPGRVRLYLD